MKPALTYSLYLSALLLPGIPFLTGCYPAQPRAERASSPALPNTAKPVPSASKQLIVPPVSAITIERYPEMRNDAPPAYALTLRSDGTATYISPDFPPRKGTYRTVFPVSDFKRLAQLVEESNFVNFAPFYGPAATDIAEVRVSVVRKGKRKTVVDWGKPFQPPYELEAPKSLTQIEQQIDAVVVHAYWIKVSKETRMPDFQPEFTFQK